MILGVVMLLYTAGAYRGDVDANIARARAVAMRCYEKGHDVICPHLQTAKMDEETGLPDDFWLNTTMNLLRRCDAIVLVPGWENSEGTKAEIAYAKSVGMPVFDEVPDFSPSAVELRPYPGEFVVFEGCDGSGKTSQRDLLRQWLETQTNRLIFVTREPGGSDFGTDVRKILIDRHDFVDPVAELLLFAADRVQHVETFLRPKLKEGAIILCDRYTDSTVAYQAYGRGLDRGVVDQLNQLATGGLQSTLTFWLDIDPEVGVARMSSRGKPDRIEQADLDFHRRVRRGYQALAERYPNRIVRIDGNRSKAEVADDIQAVFKRYLLRWN
jgi:dTMP kinase